MGQPFSQPLSQNGPTSADHNEQSQPVLSSAELYPHISSAIPVYNSVNLAKLSNKLSQQLNDYFVNNQVPDSVDMPSQVKGGGSNSTVGGMDYLQEYGNSVYSQAKEKLIRNIAEEVFRALKLKGCQSAQTAPIDEVVKHLVKIVPNPKKGVLFNESFNKSSARQKEVCDVLAKAINKNYGYALIDLQGSPETKCQQVAEVMHTLFMGLHTEFMTVAGDLLRILRNIQLLHEYVEASYKKQMELVKQCGNDQLKMQSDEVEMFYKHLQEELNRQMAMISNMLNAVIGPTHKSLVSLLEDNKQFSGMVRDIQADLGTSEFGKKLAYLLSGISSTAHAAEMIQKALKKLGMSAKDFKNAKNAHELRLKIYQHIQNKNPTSQELDKMMKAAEIIYKHDYNHDEVAKLIKGGCNNVSGGKSQNPSKHKKPYQKLEQRATAASRTNNLEETEDNVDQQPDNDQQSDNDQQPDNDGQSDDEHQEWPDHSSDDNNPEKIQGGDDDDSDEEKLPTYWQKKSITAKIKAKKRFREMLLKDFKKQLKAHYQIMVDSANKIARHIGTNIPATDDLDKFVSAFKDLPSMNKDHLHIALSGYAKDIVSKSERDRFRNQYQLVLTTLEPLLRGANSKEFKDLQTAIKGTIKAIDDFNDKMVNALTEIHVDRPEELSREVRSMVDKFYGSGSNDDDTDEKLFRVGSFVEFDKVKNEMVYRYQIANIKSNLARVSDDMKYFGQEYENVLGEEAGWLISEIKKEYNQLIELATNSEFKAPQNPANDTFDEEVKRVYDAIEAITQVKAGAANSYHPERVEVADRKKYAKKALANLWRRQRDAKIRLVEAAQAIDLYLKSFANGIAKHPDSIKSIVRMLEQVEIVANWFNERSGDNLAALFEEFPSGYADLEPQQSAAIGDTADSIVNVKGELKHLPNKDDQQNEHYYAWVEKQNHDAAHRYPGNPSLGLQMDNTNSPEHIKNLLKLGEKTVKSMRALENILSTFKSIGDKFGDLSPQDKTFMTPGQIFQALCDYVVCSAFTNSFAPGHQQENQLRAIHHGGVEAKQVQDPTVGNVDIPQYQQQQYRAEHNAAVGADYLPYTYELSDQQILNAAVSPNAVDTQAHPQYRAYGLLSGVRNSQPGAPVSNEEKFYKKTSVAMSGLPNTSTTLATKWQYHDPQNRKVRTDLFGWWDNMYDTDLLFQMTIKAIVSKVFCVVDAYRLFNRPTVDRWTHDSLNPLRMILGGAHNTTYVKIIPEALELYLRLPLLAEWYREMFGFKARDKDYADRNRDEWVLSVVPSIDGTWSEFIKLIFDTASYVEKGNYAESQVQRMLTIMNNIYRTYKSRYPNATVRNIINSFVLEMNRVFGFVMRKDIHKYLEERRRYLNEPPDLDADNETNYLNYDILDSEDQFGRNPAPSDRFVKVSDAKRTYKTRPMTMLLDKIEDLRKKIDADFRRHTNPYDNQALPVNFIETLRNYKKELQVSQDDKAQYEVVLQMIQGVNKTVSASADIHIMMHESVAAPLAVLYNIQQVLQRFNSLLHGTSIDNLLDWNKKRGEATYNGQPLAQQLNSANDLYQAAEAYFKVKYPKAKHAVHVQLAQALMGDELDRTADDHPGYMFNAHVHQVPPNASFATDENRAPNYRTIVRDQLLAVLELCANQNKLVRYNIGTTGAINIDFSNLADLCIELLAQVRNNLNKLRIYFTDELKTTLDRFENHKYPGSTNWLEEHLVQCLFKNRDEVGLDPAVSHLMETLKHASEAVTANKLYEGQPANYTFEQEFADMIYWRQDGGLPNIYTTANLKQFPFNVAPLTVNPENQTADQKTALGQLMTNADLNDAANGNIVAIPVVGFVSVDQMNTWKLNNPRYTSLFFRFNDLVHHYLNDHLDDGTLKFYIPLVESFINGAASREVVQEKAFPNVLNRREARATQPRTALVYGQRPLDSADDAPITNLRPPENTVLYHSSAVVMRAYVNAIDMRLKKKRHAYESLAEVPEYMKERMRASLPYYSKMFAEVYERAEFLRKLLSHTNLKNVVTRQNAAGGVAQRANVLMGQLEDGALNSSDNVTYMTGLLNRISEMALSIKRCADNVYKELQDTAPYFMEMYRGFINDYKQRVGELPLMPASHALLPMAAFTSPNRWDTTDVGQLLLPTKANGSDVYKYNYAARLLLARSDVEPQLDHMPGAKAIYNKYAAVSAKHSQVSASDYSQTVKSVIKLGRFLNDGASYGRLYTKQAGNKNNAINQDFNYASLFQNAGLLTIYLEHLRGQRAAHQAEVDAIYNQLVPSRRLTAEEFFSQPDDNQLDVIKKMAPYIFQYEGKDRRLYYVLQNTENPNMQTNKEDLAKVIAEVASLKNDDREKMRVYNILDMNIVPLNVHAFLREVPFVNLLNYSYTFDRMVHDFIMPSYLKDLAYRTQLTEDTLMIKPNSDVNSTRELMVKLLVHPYAELNASGNVGKEYYALLASLFTGNTNMRLGRPRYLSDQLWHKVLLTSSAQIVAGQRNYLGMSVFPSGRPRQNGQASDPGVMPFEAGPSAYEAVRAVVRYGVPLRNQIQANPTDFNLTSNRYNEYRQITLSNADYDGTGNTNNIYDAALRLVNSQGLTNDNITHLYAANNQTNQHQAGIWEAKTRNYPELSRYNPWQADRQSGLDDQVNGLLQVNNGSMHRLHQIGVSNVADELNVNVPSAIAAADPGYNLEQRLVRGLQGHVPVPAQALEPDYKQGQFRVDNTRLHLTADITNANHRRRLYAIKKALDALINDETMPHDTDTNNFVKQLILWGLAQLLRDGAAGDITNDVMDYLDAADLGYINIRNLDSNAARQLSRKQRYLLLIYHRLIYYAANGVRAAVAAQDNRTGYMSWIVSDRNNVGNYARRSFLEMYLNHHLTNLWRAMSLDHIPEPVSNQVRNMALILPSDPNMTEGLKFWDAKQQSWRVRNQGGENMHPSDVLYCADLGLVRFNTKLVRNLAWFVQLQRVMRVVITGHLAWLSTPVIKGLAIADSKVTEFNSNDQYTMDDFNEVAYDLF